MENQEGADRVLELSAKLEIGEASDQDFEVSLRHK